eukprot:TRINITY_DN74824_c0_g1_i1.p1 TRINITY_DN74824_c0_g1~~TRINITY_DN74824_c0_g1_i1.p1  ORF type:complete len:138 (+),score=15.25 TRINITY_DN74824_c0_g1_i1:386-799(+)
MSQYHQSCLQIGLYTGGGSNPTTVQQVSMTENHYDGVNLRISSSSVAANTCGAPCYEYYGTSWFFKTAGYYWLRMNTDIVRLRIPWSCLPKPSYSDVNDFELLRVDAATDEGCTEAEADAATGDGGTEVGTDAAAGD